MNQNLNTIYKPEYNARIVHLVVRPPFSVITHDFNRWSDQIN